MNAYLFECACFQDPSKQKPLLVTEFGVDALNFEDHSLNETKQAQGLADMWEVIQEYSSGDNNVCMKGVTV